MVNRRSKGRRGWTSGTFATVALAAASVATNAAPQQAGSIRGLVLDKDFDAPLALPQVTISETGQKVTGTEEGTFVFGEIPPGTYTLVFSKDGFARQIKANVVVSAGQLTEVDAALSGEFTDMDEFIVQDLQIGGGTEAGLLRLRLESPALMDSIGADLISRAGASDAAAALRLVSGATVQDGKYAVIRGLPDRYVNTQLNGVRLPTADEDKRAVDLELFPSAVIESIQVSKTFTPDQQGDASGGAVNVLLKGIPVETAVNFKLQVGFNTQVKDSTFLSYKGGGVNYWGKDDGGRNPQLDKLGENWDGAVGVSSADAPVNYKWAFDAGGRYEVDDGITIGGFASVFYEQAAQFYDNGVDNSYWVTNPGEGLVPETSQGTPEDGDFKTSLFDVTKSAQGVRWGTLLTGGIETEHNSLSVGYLYTRLADDVVTLAQDTNGKAYFFPDYDPNDPSSPGNQPENRFAAPYLRTQTLEYTERTTQALIFNGKHALPIDGFDLGDHFRVLPPELDWTISRSSATLYQPDKRQFGAQWLADSLNPGFPPFLPPFTTPATYLPYKPDANFTLGNLQRIWKNIVEESEQYAINLKLPFEQWTGTEGYLKFGWFDDHVTRTFDQNSYSNFNDNSGYESDFDNFWSTVFPEQDHPITDGPPFVDVDYDGDQRISALYAMADVPLTSYFKLIGGARFESTKISIENFPEEDAVWFPPGAISPVNLAPGDADVSLDQDNTLPSLGFEFQPIEEVIFRGSWAQTIARPIFRELTPIIQQEYLGGPIFIGNPALGLSTLNNYDLRLDYVPYEGGLLSVSWFRKDIKNPIENVQKVAGFTYTTPVNYPSGRLTGWEFEVRQSLGHFWEGLEGLSLGGNATLIQSEVKLPEDEAAGFELPNIMAPMASRNMTNAPEYLYNLYVAFDSVESGTQIGLFYTVKGDTLLAGAGQTDGNFVPDVYQTEFGTLNLTISQKLGEFLKLTFQAKNLTNPTFTEVYRSPYIGADVTKRSFSLGIDFSIALSASFTF
ncbi:MAG: TonB-dependent receptor [Phycisphaerales bacterium]|nr:TonB-dependent receptor [Phycisphaerales bacterium]